MSGALASTGSSTLDDIAAVIGETAAFALARHFGGIDLAVPASVGPNHPITVAIGATAAAELVSYFHGTTLRVPKRVERRRRVAELAAKGLTRQRIALETDYSERHVYRLLATESAKADQLDLFGDGQSDT